jgi:hypothetical protein
VGEQAFLKVKSKRISLKIRSFPKLAMRYCGTFEVLEKIGPIAYMLASPASMRIWNVNQVEHEGDFRVEPMCILD